ncbi:MAG: ABC transporter ATP-binding protein, partial [Bacteroidaceae bacterium]|nr:ABC transporter ATP-binding protein [Bacteroidaceae bacterium]
QVIGVVLTDKLEVQNLRVEELVGLGRSPYTGFWGSLRENDNVIVQEAISQVGIQDLSQRMVMTLSDGERQKAMIAKALAQQTPVIILDEPTAFLDYPSKVELMQLLAKLAHDMDKTIFLSTHDLEIALQVADKVWLLEHNSLNIGTPKQLLQDGSLQRAFGRQGITFGEYDEVIRISIA